ncbi:MAG TPA: amino acid permease [Leptospiraceae bacterium]|nr:amino acid permease [Leptospiraceae bacterium]HMW07085.1 amino acid permease [Leptospiraceae bacterium]HMX32259.1 amino acid permease [Leptospiraceae bacterium]HMY32598.1 amino acid permease [Leptospiraceae bacterium]HMZ67579.1 amino acid permease [Leptospiraceae bacterium]
MELKRTLSLTDSVSLMFSSMVGSGVFFTTGFILNKVENPWLVITCWVLGGIFAIAGAVTFAYPAVIFPEAGGDYIYLKKAYSPLVAFMSGWASLTVNFSASISVLGIAFSKYLQYIFPSLKDLPSFKTHIGPIPMEIGTTQLIGAGLITFFSVINYFGIKQAVRLQNVFTSIKISGLLILVIAGFAFGKTDFTPLHTNSFFPDIFQNVNLLILGIVPVSFSYLGWNMVTYVAGEIKDPRRIIPLSIAIACIMVMSLYICINLLFLVSAPISELKGQGGIGVIAAKHLFGEGITTIISIFICWIILGSMSAMIIGGSRIYYAMANDGLFFHHLADLHPKYASPYKALIFQCVYSSILILFNQLEDLLYFITCAILFLSSLTAFIPFVLKKEYKNTSDYKIPLYPLPPLLYIIANAVLITILAYEQPMNAVKGIGITLLAIPVYYLFSHTFKKPVEGK